MLQTTLSAITALEEHWWDEACLAIKETALKYEREMNLRGSFELEALVMESTRQQVSREAMNFLASSGLSPHSPEEAYAMLFVFAEQGAAYTEGTQVLGFLPNTLQVEPVSPYGKHQRKMEIARLVHEL